MRRAILHFLKSEDGPTAVEYAVMLAMIASAVVGSVLIVGTATNASLSDSSAQIAAAAGS